jgi:hypothetical protein
MTRGPQGFFGKIPGSDSGYRLLTRSCPSVGAWSSSEKAPYSFVSISRTKGGMMLAFDEVAEKVTDAVRHVEADSGASPVLVAVVAEFQAKLAKAAKHATGGLPDHDFVVELEQAGDTAEADAGLSSDARESVLAAHLAICKLKAGA